MGASVAILAVTISLHLIAFVFAIGAERRRSTALLSVVLLLGLFSSSSFLDIFGKLSEVGLDWILRLPDLKHGTRVTFLSAESCLLAGSARNAYHTKYRGAFQKEPISCATLRKGVFAAGAAMTLLSMIGSVFYYWIHSKVDTGGWEKHQNDGIGMATSNMPHQPQNQTDDFSKP
ncbi:hypothetical protein KSS87_002478 [Heliosperma pusillum]|nr:hypothetical protein KSS87_002478 [Heliosperma pusillum]